jgi:hypothetical protein
VFSIGLAWLLGGVLHLNGVVLAMLLSELFIAIACAWLAYNAMTDSHLRKAISQ